VIDVAKSMSEQTQVDALSPVRSLEAPVNKEAGVTSPIELEAEPAPAIDVKAAAQGWQRTAALPDDRAEAIKAERRRSNYEKYASITLPPLKEVKTPDVTPAPSLSRATAKPPDPAEIVMEEIVPPDHPVAEHRLESKNDRPNMPVPTVEPDVAGPDEDEVHFSKYFDISGAPSITNESFQIRFRERAITSFRSQISLIHTSGTIHIRRFGKPYLYRRTVDHRWDLLACLSTAHILRYGGTRHSIST
jgi:hypothetical protein